MRHRLSAALPLAFVVALLAATPAFAAINVFYVEGTGDAALAGCQPVPVASGSFRCDSLRAAVNASDANANPAGEGDVIFLQAAGTYALTQAPELALTDNVTIVGRGPRTTTVRGNGSARVFSIPAGVTASLSRLAIAGGRAAQSSGGNISNAGTLFLSGVRITDGSALAGGGLANLGGGSATISASLIDNNTATGTRTFGGGILNGTGAGAAAPPAATLTMINTTLAFNRITGSGLGTGAGIGTVGTALNRVQLVGVTIARNSIAPSTSGVAGIGIGTTGEQVSIYGSIVAANTLATGVPANCGGQGIPTEGSTATNLDDGSTCGFQFSNSDPGLSTALVDQGGDTDVLTIPPASGGAKRLVNSCFYPDQRNAPRPSPGPCDAGAFEEGAVAPPIDSEPLPEPDAAPQPAPAPTAQPTVIPTPTPTPTPVFKQTVVIKPVSGKVRVRRPGSNEFVDVDATAGIPLGSTLDTKNGVIELTSLAKLGGTPQTAKFFDGIFKVTQPGATTDLTLNEPLAPCKKGKASAAARKPKTRRLWGDGKGQFRTRGQYSAATVRGTKWLVQDSCAGTLTRVTQGVVSVRDNVRKKTIVLRAGKSYVAKPPR